MLGFGGRAGSRLTAWRLEFSEKSKCGPIFRGRPVAGLVIPISVAAKSEVRAVVVNLTLGFPSARYAQSARRTARVGARYFTSAGGIFVACQVTACHWPLR